MTDAAMSAPASRTPWHFWLVVVLAVLWNGFAAFDYLMTVTENQQYFDAMGLAPAQVDYFTNMPLWLDSAWAIAVWAAVLATLALIVRKGWAVWLFVISFIAMLCSSGFALLDAGLREAMGTIGLASAVVIVVVALFEIFYSAAMKTRSVLH